MDRITDRDPEHEARLWTAYAKTRSIEDRNALVVYHYPLLRYFCWRMWNYLGRSRSAGIDDLEQDALPGLVRAVELFDRDRDIKFSTYCCVAMGGRIRQAFNRWLQCPRDFTRADRLKHGVRRPESLESLLATDDFDPPMEVREREYLTPPDWFDRLRKWLCDRDHKVLLLRYRDGLSQREAAASIGLSVARLSQIENRAIRLLKKRTVREVVFE